jgi:hypothetical protein
MLTIAINGNNTIAILPEMKEIFKTAKSRTSQGIDTTKIYCGPYNELLTEATNNKQKER